jgi:hypothetical protein
VPDPPGFVIIRKHSEQVGNFAFGRTEGVNGRNGASPPTKAAVPAEHHVNVSKLNDSGHSTGAMPASTMI